MGRCRCGWSLKLGSRFNREERISRLGVQATDFAQETIRGRAEPILSDFLHSAAEPQTRWSKRALTADYADGADGLNLSALSVQSVVKNLARGIPRCVPRILHDVTQRSQGMLTIRFNH
jgi:hypothetical protein